MLVYPLWSSLSDSVIVEKEQILRILHLVHQYPPHFIGGTEQYTRSVATAQAESGHDVAVFVPTPDVAQRDAGLPAPDLENGVKIYRIPIGNRSRLQVFLHTFREPSLRRSWQAVLQTERPDLVHIEHLMGMPAAAASDLLDRSIPFVVTLHDYWYLCANAQLLTNTDQTICAGPDDLALNCTRCAVARAGLKGAGGIAPLLAPIMKRRNRATAAVLKAAGRVIAPTSFVRDIYEGLMPRELHIDVLPHGIKLPQSSIDKAQSERRRDERDGRLRVGYIGNIARQKGPHILIDAVNFLPEQDIALTLYGDTTVFPDYVSELQTSIGRPGIKLGGTLSREELWQAIAGFDIVVLPTLWYETSVLVIDEVHAMGVPVIGSDIGVMREKILDGVNGRLFPPGDADALRAILLEIINEPEMIEAWRQNIRPVNSIAQHISALEEIYAAVLDAV
jgi:glycosyltransferase involved in cell wall biosynthesis